MCYKLNEDSWTVILQYVGLKDQLSLMQVSEEMNTIVQNNWRYIKEAHMDKDILGEFNEEPNEMHNFLKLACRSLQRLLLYGPFLNELLPSWKSYDFPKVRSLDCATWFAYEHDDDVTLLLTELFPELTKLTLRNTNHGHHLWNFRKLQELTLHSSSLDTPTLDRIFGSLPLRKLSLFPFCTSEVGDLSLVHKCATLEELLIEDYNLTFGTLSSLLKLSRFQRLCFYTRDYYYNYMRNLKHLDQESRVRSLLFNSCSWYFHDDLGLCVARFSNLCRLVVQDDDINMKQLYIICSNLKILEELHLIDIRDFPFATDMWNMVGACRTLKVLNISDNKLHEFFLEESSTCLNKVLKRRNANSPVTFHVHKTRLANDPQRTIDALHHPYLKISFNPVHIDTLTIEKRAFIETEFRPF
ncbi:uncharacterized protein LOC117786547 [Drosophila innubila]|uniref:uncharacterized protein LOC117786547 n=1 Tax=Drosophila innubila TaxID=198719 RepID=UPI00148E79DE|nr:uncharacterized protein LOC117786547 [Drosophila innubila]